MVSALISRVMVLGVGTLWPAYRSYKAVKSKDVREYVKWMMYWIVFALYLCIETFLDLFVAFWLPFYYELKILFVLWLLTPYTKGASVLFRKFIYPTLNEHEDSIDLYIDQARHSGVSTITKLASHGVTYAREVVANAAIGGGNHLLSTIQRSYSLSDLDKEDNRRTGPQIEEILEEEEEEVTYEGAYDEDGRLVERRIVKAKNGAGDEEDDDDEDFEELDVEEPRGSKAYGLRPRKKKDRNEEDSKYATLPRSGARSGWTGRGGTRRT